MQINRDGKTDHEVKLSGQQAPKFFGQNFIHRNGSPMMKIEH